MRQRSSAAVETVVEKEPESSNTVNRNEKLKTENEIVDIVSRKCY